jgi:hypothetical protein
MWESPSEYDAGYDQIDPYEYPIYSHRHNTCEKCGKVISYNSGKYCQKHQPGFLALLWESFLKIFNK